MPRNVTLFLCCQTRVSKLKAAETYRDVSGFLTLFCPILTSVPEESNNYVVKIKAFKIVVDTWEAFKKH